MEDKLAHPSRVQRRVAAHIRMRRITSNIGNEADALVQSAAAPNSTRLTPAEHWQFQGKPAKATGIQARFRLPRRDSWLDWALLVVEVVAVVGLVSATALSVGALGRLQNEVLTLPTSRPLAVRTVGGRATVSPTARAAGSATPGQVVMTSSPAASKTVTSVTRQPTLPGLPVGSKTPTATATGATRTPTPSATPAATPDSPTGVRFVIPTIGVDAPMVEGDDWETLKYGIGHRITSAWPGERGNAVIAAHNDVYGSIFAKLTDLQPGEPVFAYTPSGVYRYEMVSSRLVLPNEVSVTDPTSEPILTLITCYPPLIDTHRYVVTARLVETEPTYPDQGLNP